jgi:flavin reductase (DIM6/NTAB) family NADH-FMN oxidoreductase RutF
LTVTIHSGNPFPSGERSAVRQFRGRMAGAVSVWTSGTGRDRAGWTVSSFLVADGEPAEVLGLLDDESDLADRVGSGATFVVSLLGWLHRSLAEAFAGLAPAPGGVFRLGSWVDTDWGPALSDAPAWLGARSLGGSDHAGWGLLVRADVEHATIGLDPADGLLTHVRGRYQPLLGDDDH